MHSHISNTSQLSVVMLGATGTTGGIVLKTLLKMPEVKRLTLLGRNTVPDVFDVSVQQFKINIFDPDSYNNYLSGHTTAICTLGVGQPSKSSKEDFIKIDKEAVIDFARGCKSAGIPHFELLASVGISSKSPSFYLRTKGELVEELKALNFERLSIFQPSMILTPTNRYGFSQAVTLKVWPLLKPFLISGLKKFRGIPVDILGKSIARNVTVNGSGYEVLQWDDFYKLAKSNNAASEPLSPGGKE